MAALADDVIIIIYLHIYIYIVSDVKDSDEKCKTVNCSALYDAIIASSKLLYDLISMCAKKKT